MALHIFPAGTTSKTIQVTIRQDGTGANPGNGKTGIAAASVTCYYHRSGASAPVQIPLIAADAVGTWKNSTTNYGWIEVSSSNTPGLYEISLPDAAIAAGVTKVTITYQITGAIQHRTEIILTDPVRGLGAPTALPNVATGGTGSLPVVDSGGKVAAKLAAADFATDIEVTRVVKWATSNVASGDALSAAIAAASEGRVLIGESEFDLTNAGTVAVPAGIAIEGRGIARTILSGELAGYGLLTADAGKISDLAIHTPHIADPVGMIPLAFEGSSGQTLVVDRVEIVGEIDGIYMSSTGTLRLSDSTIRTQWDAINTPGGGTFIAERVLFDVRGPYIGAGGAEEDANGVHIQAGCNATLRDCVISATNTGGNAAVGVSATGGAVVVLYGCKIRSSGSSLFADNATIIAIGCDYDRTTAGTSNGGTIVDLPAASVRADGTTIPTAAQTAAAVAAQARGTVEGSIGKGIADAASAAGAAQTAAEAVQAKLPSAGGIIGTSTLTQLQAQAAVDAALDATDTDTTSGWATTLRGKIRQLYRSVFGKNVYDRTAQTRTMYADDGTTARTTQTWASTAQTQSTSKAT